MKLGEDLYIYPWTQQTANNCNCYQVGKTLIDPGHAHLFSHVEAQSAQDAAPETEVVLLTHCHPDHLEAGEKLQAAGAKLGIHEEDKNYMEGEGRALAASLGMRPQELVFDFFLDEGEITCGGETLRVIHTPGHSPGHVCFYWGKEKALFSGDLVFVQGVGRVDFPGGDAEALKASILKVAELDIELLLPGHGPALKGAENVATNFKMIEEMYFPIL